ncbi:MAG: hypothetical protein Kow0042_04620 [Calditrichia bacterium]
MMKRSDLASIYEQLQSVQRKIENYKHTETHLEINRLLKLVDAELLDALHNLEKLLEILDQESRYA